MAWSAEKFFPHLQWWGTFFSCHPYRKLIASRNSPFLKLKPWSCNGRTDSQDEDLFSHSMQVHSLCFGGGRLSLTWSATFSISCCFFRHKFDLIDCSCGLVNNSFCLTIISFSGSLIFCEAWYSSLALVTGLMMLRPPDLRGKERSVLSS